MEHVAKVADHYEADFELKKPFERSELSWKKCGNYRPLILLLIDDQHTDVLLYW